MSEPSRTPTGTPPDGGIRRWLDFEQTHNERLIHPLFLPQHHQQTTVRPQLRPEHRAVWRQELVWLPRKITRTYGFPVENLHAALGLTTPAGRVPFFLHPQPTRAQARLARTHGKEWPGSLLATPTSSYRSVVAWREDGAGTRAAVLKLSIGALIGRRRRAFRENQIARAIVINALFASIPAPVRGSLRFDWFAEVAGVVDAQSRRGWLLRRLPAMLAAAGRSTLLPAFSLIAPRPGRSPLLVDFIRNSGAAAEDFVVERILRPYVRTVAHLLYGEGLHYEGHAQNVLLEVAPNDQLTGRLILRDLADATVNLAFRLARRQSLPAFPAGFFPRRAPFPITGNACDYRCDFDTPRVVRGFDTVERYGLWGFVWPINTALGRHFPRYRHAEVERRYLELWQSAAIKHLGLRPLFRAKPKGLATDETFSYFLRQTDWRALGATRARLPAAAEPLLIEGKMRRRAGAVYERLESAWGDLFVFDGLPGFFRPAF